MSFGDGHLQKKRYAINTSSDFVAFASTNPATITRTGTDDSVSTIELVRIGSTSNTPYYVRISNVPEGSLFESDQEFAAWYQPNSNTDASDGDETLMFGFD